MKLKILFTAMFVTVSFFSFAQENVKNPKNNTVASNVERSEDTPATKIKKIEFDYATKSYKNDEIYKSLTVNDWVSVTIKNLPKAKNARATVTFTNHNLEQMGTFGGYIAMNGKGSGNESETATTGKSDLEKEVKDKLDSADSTIVGYSKAGVEDAILTKYPKKESEIQQLFITAKSPDDFEKKIKSSFPKASALVLNNKTYKVDESTMKKDLEIGQVEKFVNEYLKNNPKDKLATDAKADYLWQKVLIGYLHDNIKDKLKIRDQIIDSLIVIIDKQGKQLAEDTYDKNFPPVKIENFDSTEFVVVIDNDKSKDEETIKIPFRNRKGFKLDFSTGFLVSGLYDENYSIRPNGSDNVQLKEEFKNKLNLGITLLAHAYCRGTRFINPAITSGLSINLNTQTLNYVLGGSLLLGEDQRFIISLGAVLGKVKALPNYYKKDINIPTTELPETSAVPLVDKLKLSWFVGITYNLGISGKQKTIGL